MSSRRRRWLRHCLLAVCVAFGFAPGVGVAQQVNSLLSWSSAYEKQMKGDQKRYLQRLRALPGVASVDVAAVNAQYLRDGAKVTIAVAPGARPAVLMGGFAPCGTLREVWHGSDSDDTVSAMLLARQGRVQGTVWTPSGAYEIGPLCDTDRDLHTVMRVSCRNVTPGPKPTPLCAFTPPPTRKPATCPEPSVDRTRTITLLAAYTQAASAIARNPCWYGDPDLDMEQTMELAVCTANRTYRASGIAVELDLVGVVKTHYHEASLRDCYCLPKDAERLRTGFGVLGIVHRYRDVLAADLVVLMTGSISCPGMAAPPMGDSEKAFAVVGVAFASSAYTLAHEIGHLQGAQHVLDHGYADYSCGHGRCGSGWRTIMAGADECRNSCRAGVWSNPATVFRGETTGSETQNNARVLNCTASAIEDYRKEGTLTVAPEGVTVAQGHTALLEVKVAPSAQSVQSPTVWVRSRNAGVAFVKEPNGPHAEEWYWAVGGNAQVAVQGLSEGHTAIDVRSEGVHVVVPVRVVPPG